MLLRFKKKDKDFQSLFIESNHVAAVESCGRGLSRIIMLGGDSIFVIAEDIEKVTEKINKANGDYYE